MKMNSRGQAVTESILIIVLLMGFTMIVANYIKKEEVFKRLITGPFVFLAGMMQNGVWQSASIGAASHPANHNRHVVITGDKVQ